MNSYLIKNYSLNKKKINSQIKIKLFNKLNFIRIYLSGEGCSGFKYNFINENLLKINDILFIFFKKKILIDIITYKYIFKSKIKIKNNKLFLKNPNIKNSCNCKMSFNF